MTKSATTVIFLALNLFVSGAFAHTEHQEVQVKSTFEINSRQQLSSISMVWLFDTFSSADMLEHEKDINRLAKVLISDLSRFNFFTRLNSGDRRLVANRVNKYKLRKVKDRDQNRALELSFTLLFNKPVNISQLKDININHSDPTGRNILFYDSSADIKLSGKLKSICQAEVREKNEFIEGQFPQIAKITCRT